MLLCEFVFIHSAFLSYNFGFILLWRVGLVPLILPFAIDSVTVFFLLILVMLNDTNKMIYHQISNISRTPVGD